MHWTDVLYPYSVYSNLLTNSRELFTPPGLMRPTDAPSQCDRPLYANWVLSYLVWFLIPPEGVDADAAAETNTSGVKRLGQVVNVPKVFCNVEQLLGQSEVVCQYPLDSWSKLGTGMDPMETLANVVIGVREPAQRAEGPKLSTLNSTRERMRTGGSAKSNRVKAMAEKNLKALSDVYFFVKRIRTPNAMSVQRTYVCIPPRT